MEFSVPSDTPYFYVMLFFIFWFLLAMNYFNVPTLNKVINKYLLDVQLIEYTYFYFFNLFTPTIKT